MSSGIYTAMMGARAQEHALETVNNNLANVNTPGFKRLATIYREIHNDAAKMDNSLQGEDIHSPVRFLPDDRIAGVMVERYTHFDQGPLKQTGNPFDVALEGEGFFVVQGPKGNLFTRNGAFSLQADGTLTAGGGEAVLDDALQPIRIPDTASQVSITREGSIQVGGGTVGKLAVVRFDDPQVLQRTGNSEWQLLSPQVQPQPVASPNVQQGWLESSNVNAVSTMTAMIKVSRIFELNSKIIMAYKQMDQQAAQEVGRSVS